MMDRDRLFVYVAHAYGADTDGWSHAVRLSNMARDDSEYAVALCHDLIEDGYATLDDLIAWGLTEEEQCAVLHLTRDPSILYSLYIGNILLAWKYKYKGGQLAAIVKYYDLVDHMHPARMNKKHADKLYRYLPAYQRIVGQAAKGG